RQLSVRGNHRALGPFDGVAQVIDVHGRGHARIRNDLLHLSRRGRRAFVGARSALTTNGPISARPRITAAGHVVRLTAARAARRSTISRRTSATTVVRAAAPPVDDEQGDQASHYARSRNRSKNAHASCILEERSRTFE